jgi:hypothetical protein
MQEAPLGATSKLRGLVENMSQVCICGRLLELRDMTVEKEYALARLACSRFNTPGFHSVLIIEQSVHRQGAIFNGAADCQSPDSQPA